MDKKYRMSRLMLWASFLSCLFYSMSYPYIYAETVKVVPHYFLSLEQILCCISTIVFCKLWNKYSDNFFRYYWLILLVEIFSDLYLFVDVLIRGNLRFYFLLNIIIYALITRNIGCGGIKMRAMVNPTEKLREKYDNNNQIVSSVATLLGAALFFIFDFELKSLFIFALVGNTIDNFFYLYIYCQIQEDKSGLS